MSSQLRLAPKRGLAYQCLKCPLSNPYIGEKKRVMSHFKKLHLALGDFAFGCRLCMFRADTEDEFQKHLTQFKPHLSRRAEQGARYPGDQAFKMVNQTPYLITSKDVMRLSSQQSKQYWNSRTGASAAVSVPPTSTLDQPMPSIQPIQITTFPSQQQQPPSFVLVPYNSSSILTFPSTTEPAPTEPSTETSTESTTRPLPELGILSQQDLPPCQDATGETPLSSPVRRIVESDRLYDDEADNQDEADNI